jgi:hypothetical protein
MKKTSVSKKAADGFCRNIIRLAAPAAIVAVLAFTGCGTIPAKREHIAAGVKISKTQSYDIRIRHDAADEMAAKDLGRVLKDLTADVPWAAETIAKYGMSFVFSSDDSYGEYLASYGADDPFVINVNPDFRDLLNGVASDFFSVVSGDKDYSIKRTILHELIHKEQDARGVMKLIENLKPSDYCVAANFMEIDPSLKADFMLGRHSQETRDMFLESECENWDRYEAYTNRNFWRSISNRPDGRRTSVSECIGLAAECGPSDAGYGRAAVERAIPIIAERTWGEKSEGRDIRLGIKQNDKSFFERYPMLSNPGAGR